jgi:phospholipase/carboxylesterase
VSAPRPAAEGRLESRPQPEPTGPPLPAGVSRLELGPGVEVHVAVPIERAAAVPLLVFCHGAGGTGADALRAVEPHAAARGVVVVAPSSAASTWDLIAGGLGRDVAVVDAALEEVFARTAVSRVALGGFSDGASYALSLGVANGDLVDSVLAFSPGFLAPPARTGRPAVRVCHGTEDRVLPVDRCGRRVVEQLERSGYDVTYDEFAGGHVLTPDLVDAGLGWWLGRGSS